MNTAVATTLMSAIHNFGGMQGVVRSPIFGGKDFQGVVQLALLFYLGGWAKGPAGQTDAGRSHDPVCRLDVKMDANIEAVKTPWKPLGL